jgi:uncharacterized protein involved in outer membrane biogenesis
MTRRKVLISGAVVASVVGLYALLGFYWVPRFVHGQVLDTFSTRYGREAELASVRFNPFTFEFEARGLSVPDQDGERLLGFDRLYLDFELSSALYRAWTFDSIAIEAPYVRVVQRADGSLNLADLASPGPGAEPPAAEADEPAAIPSIRIGRLDVTGGRIDVEDLARAEPFVTTLSPVSFRLDDFRTAGEGNHFAFEAGSDRAGRLALEGSLGVSPLASSGTLTLTGLEAATLSEYLGTLLPLEIRRGAIDLGFSYDFRLEGEPLYLTLDMPLLAVRELETVGRGQDDAWLVPAIEVRDARLDLAARSVRIGEIEVRDAVTPVWLDDAGLQLPGVLSATPPPADQDSADQEQSAEAESGPEWRLDVPEIALLDSRLAFEDRTGDPVARLDLQIPEVRVRGLAWPARGPLEVAARVEPVSGGALSAAGSVATDPVSANLDVEIESLALRPAQAWLSRGTGVNLASGSLQAKLRVDYDGAAEPAARVAGDVAVLDLSAQDVGLEEDFVTWKRLDVRGLEYASRPGRLEIREILATGPYLRLILGADGITNIETVLDPEGAARKAARLAAERESADREERDRESRQAAESADDAASSRAGPDAGPAFPVKIGVVRIADGSTNFTDYTLTPKFEISIEQLEGQIQGLTSAAEGRATVQLEGQVDRYAPARVDGEINPLAADAFVDLAASFRNIELTTFDPYSGKFAGYHIEKGKLTIETKYRVENRQLDANHKFIVNQLELGEKVDSPDAVGLPLKLAVALLKDRNGVIDLDLPVTGSLDDPQFKLGPIIWKAFVSLIGKIATAPFALLGNLFGGGEDLSYVDFTPGSSELTAAAAAKLDTLKKALEERPGLRLDVPSPVAPDADRDALVAMAWDRAVGEAGQPAGTVDDSWQTDRAEYLRRLRTMYGAGTGTVPDVPTPPKPAEGEAPVDPVEFAIGQLEPGLKATITIPDEGVADLGEARAEAVRDALLGDGVIDPGRVFIISGEPAGLADGSVRMELSLK